MDSGVDGVWRTINGEPVFIRDGIITKGPRRLIGKTHGEAKTIRRGDKSKIATANAVPIKAEEQRYSEEHNEPHLANSLKDAKAGRNAVSLRDNEAADVLVTKDGRIEHGVELKTMVNNTNDKITMSKSAIEKKQAWVASNKAPIHTVVYDDRNVYNKNGEGQHGDESGRKIYYKRGAGSFRTTSMHEVSSPEELKSLISSKEEDLPEAARSTPQWKSSVARHLQRARAV